jgi:hypothetical protein
VARHDDARHRPSIPDLAQQREPAPARQGQIEEDHLRTGLVEITEGLFGARGGPAQLHVARRREEAAECLPHGRVVFHDVHPDGRRVNRHASSKDP